MGVRSGPGATRNGGAAKAPDDSQSSASGAASRLARNKTPVPNDGQLGLRDIVGGSVEPDRAGHPLMSANAR